MLYDYPPLDHTNKWHSSFDNITLPSLHNNSVSWSDSLSVRGLASQLLFQLSQPVGLLLEVSQTLDKEFIPISLSFCQLFNQSFCRPVSQSLKQSASNPVTQTVSKLDS